MIPINDLIRIFTRRINHLPDSPSYQQEEIDSAALVYFNAYRQLKTMLKDLARDVQDIEAGETLT